MFNRFVFVKLIAEHSTDEGIAEVLKESLRVLPTLPGVVRCTVGRPADDHAGKGWDLCLTLEFKSLDDIETYRVHPEHQTFLKEFLGPRVEAKRVWNFSMQES